MSRLTDLPVELLVIIVSYDSSFLSNTQAAKKLRYSLGKVIFERIMAKIIQETRIHFNRYFVFKDMLSSLDHPMVQILIKNASIALNDAVDLGTAFDYKRLFIKMTRENLLENNCGSWVNELYIENMNTGVTKYISNGQLSFTQLKEMLNYHRFCRNRASSSDYYAFFDLNLNNAVVQKYIDNHSLTIQDVVKANQDSIERLTSFQAEIDSGIFSPTKVLHSSTRQLEKELKTENSEHTAPCGQHQQLSSTTSIVIYNNTALEIPTITSSNFNNS